MNKTISAVILAAGKGTRMRSDTPKALFEVSQRSMVSRVIDTARSAGIDDIVVIGGYRISMLEKALAKSNVTIIRQKKLLGSADAVKQASVYLSRKKPQTVVVLYADTPLIRPATIKKMLASHYRKNSDLTLLSAVVDDAKEYGRIVRDKKGMISGISEYADFHTGTEGKQAEVNVGAYCFDRKKMLQGLLCIKKNMKKGEYYLTDIVDYFYRKSCKIDAHALRDIQESLGVNTRHDAVIAETILGQRSIERLIEKGVIIKDPSKVCIAEDAVISQSAVIYPFVVIEKGVIIGPGCQVGPFARLRTGAVLKKDSSVGNYVEINRSVLGRSSRAKHHAYLGDAIIKDNVNIGAGTITANYNGKKKNKTTINSGAFIGSNTTIVAPADIGRRAATGAGSVILRNTRVPDDSVFAGVPARPLRKKDKVKNNRRRKTGKSKKG
jgi:bifunctional UDP-N-acetylglucosamine pyrophosphorylase / glucosamine-1-phosphate N-acetyltransferase